MLYEDIFLPNYNSNINTIILQIILKILSNTSTLPEDLNQDESLVNQIYAELLENQETLEASESASDSE